ncbi:MAG: hypothetical protein E7353_07695 [Clostridiales bacterium]|nr:hypothetical protein [Clostridiales bacterium]
MKAINFDNCIGSYDKSLFYKNDYSINCADPGALWVSKEMNEEWGGYFYIYLTGEIHNKTEVGDKISAYKCYRSKDLSTWEVIGQAQNGGCLKVEDDAWAYRFFWAPEVTYNPADKKFYIFYSAGSKLAGENTEYTANEEDMWSGLYLSIAVSDTPAGPFVMVDSKDMKGGVNLNGDVLSRFNPTINFEKKLNIGHTWSAIDVSPFWAPDGSLYIYFAKHCDKFHKGICVYGMKMKDIVTPDYSTLTKLTHASVKQVIGKAGELDAEKGEEEIREGGVNEGPFMTYHNGKYYLTYSPFGYGSREYSIMQAVSDSPLGPFNKVAREVGNPSLGINSTNDYIAGTGHHNFAYADGEIIAVYHAHKDPVEPYVPGGGFKGRVLAVDKMHFVYNEELGYDILMGNGPTTSLQPVARVTATYLNKAMNAKIVSNAVSGEKYLNDDLFTTQPFDWHKEAEFDKTAQIEISFDKAEKVKGVMVYNSADYKYAFDKVDKIVYTLANGEQVYVENVLCDEANVCREKQFMRQGGSAIAVTDELEVTKIEITVSSKYDNDNETIKISDIAVLAKRD